MVVLLVFGDQVKYKNMAWNYPSELYVIDELTELVNFSRTLTYNDLETYPTETWTVNIVPSIINSTVNVSGGTISGYYSSAFDGYSIQFLDKNKQYKTVLDWNSVSNAKEMIKYTPSMQQTKTFNYTATATSSPSNLTTTQVFTIVVTNNWTIGKNLLQAAVAQTIAERI